MTTTDGQKSFQDRLARLEKSQIDRGRVPPPAPPPLTDDGPGPGGLEPRASGGMGVALFGAFKLGAILVVLIMVGLGVVVAFDDRLGTSFAIAHLTGALDLDEMETSDPAAAAETHAKMDALSQTGMFELTRDSMKELVTRQAQIAGVPSLGTDAVRKLADCAGVNCLEHVVETFQTDLKQHKN